MIESERCECNTHMTLLLKACWVPKACFGLANVEWDRLCSHHLCCRLQHYCVSFCVHAVKTKNNDRHAYEEGNTRALGPMTQSTRHVPFSQCATMNCLSYLYSELCKAWWRGLLRTATLPLGVSKQLRGAPDCSSAESKAGLGVCFAAALNNLQPLAVTSMIQLHILFQPEKSLAKTIPYAISLVQSFDRDSPSYQTASSASIKQHKLKSARQSHCSQAGLRMGWC